jgi:carbonic anhydrase/acetyltransferase-like protein (isoleucine patch superfamily)
MIRPYKRAWPRLGQGVYVDASAQVIGDVELGDHSSIWMNTVVRGDVNWIRIGRETNIQDNCVVHVEDGLYPAQIGDRVTVGHSVTLHGCRVESHCLIGMGAVVLNGAVVGEGSIVAAGAVVPEGMQVPPGSLVMGVPARVKRSLTDEERADIERGADHYLEYKEDYLAEPRQP